MGLEKAISSGQEHRRPHRGAKAVCFNCRNHGTCDYCRSNRLHSTRKREVAADAQQENMRCISAAERTPPQMIFMRAFARKHKPVIRAVAQITGLSVFVGYAGQAWRTRHSPRV